MEATRLDAGVGGRRAAWALVCLAAAGALVVLILMSARWSTRDGKGLLDWGSFVASGRAANEGKDPYGVYPLTFRVGPGGAPAPNLNPPVSVYPFQAAAHFNPVTSQHAWYAISLALYGLAVVLLLRSERRQAWPLWLLWALALGGLWHTLELEQIYVPLLLLAAGAWLGLQRRQDVWAGICMGAIGAVKPTFLIWPGLMLLARHWRVAIAGFATAAVLFAIPLAVSGPEIYREWFAVTPSPFVGQPLAGNSALPAIAARLGVTGIGVAAAIALGAALALWALARRPGVLAVSAAALLGALLIGPISWPGYTIILLPALISMRVSRLSLVAFAILCFPYWLVIDWADASKAADVILGSVYAWALLLLLLDLGRQEFRLREVEAGASAGAVPERRRRPAVAAGGLAGWLGMIVRVLERP